jgi:hypothetical protein
MPNSSYGNIPGEKNINRDELGGILVLLRKEPASVCNLVIKTVASRLISLNITKDRYLLSVKPNLYC